MSLAFLRFSLPVFLLISFSTAYADEASTYCEVLGGTVETYPSGSEKVSELSLCRIGNSGISTWTPQTSNARAIEAFLQYEPHKPVFKGLINPTVPVPVGGVPALSFAVNNSTTYCQQVGGLIWEFIKAPPSKKLKLCFFEKDQSFIDAETLFYGPEHERNLQLTTILRDSQ